MKGNKYLVIPTMTTECFYTHSAEWRYMFKDLLSTTIRLKDWEWLITIKAFRRFIHEIFMWVPRLIYSISFQAMLYFFFISFRTQALTYPWILILILCEYTDLMRNRDLIKWRELKGKSHLYERICGFIVW